jgi:hypothetical protein
MNLTVTLPAPHAKQLEIMRHPARHKVVCAGRRGGKTFFCAELSIEGLLDGKKVLLTSTTQDQADTFWDYIKDWLHPLIETKVAYKNEARRIIRMGAGRIHVKTGRDPDVLRGGDADLLVLDECALLDPDAWDKVGAPMLADRDGTVIFISTPRRKNWFYQMYLRGLDPLRPDWKSFHFTTLDNPHLSERAVAELGENMTEESYRQEILAEFLEGQGQVFRRVGECAVLDAITRPGYYPLMVRPAYPGRFVFGVDWAQTQDYTVISIMDVKTRELVAVDRFNQIDWELQRARLTQLAEAWKPERIICEINSVGSPNFEALDRQGLPVEAFNTTISTKGPLIESLVLAFEREEIAIINDGALIGELEAYERKVSPITMRSTYSAPEGMHDDMVMSLALAWHGVVNPPLPSLKRLQSEGLWHSQRERRNGNGKKNGNGLYTRRVKDTPGS